MRIMFVFILIFVSSTCFASPKQDKEFNNFVEGALEVYSQFKTPSKAESERFYAFLQDKWTDSECKTQCGVDGYIAGKQYVKEKNIKIKDRPRRGNV